MKTGQLDLNDYIIVGNIGSGGNAKVFKVKDKKTGEIFAAKVPIKEITDDTDQNEIIYLRREISILLKLDHPSILKIIGFSPNGFPEKNKPTIITKYFSNGSLSQIIDLERRSLSNPYWDDTKKLINIYGIAKAMSFLHSYNIIHRDLKPLNILMDDHLFPIIADFGLSKFTKKDEDILTQTGIGIKGTPIYMAPEIIENSEYSEKSDVYAFAIVVYEIITAQEPYKNMRFSPYRLLQRISKGYRPNFDVPISEPYKELIEKCWNQDPSLRPSFNEIVTDLKENRDYLTDNVDENDFYDYIDFIETGKKTFDFDQKSISISDILDLNKISSDSDSDPTIDYFILGMKYYNGEGSPVDKEKAASYFKIAADKKKNPDAILQLGLMKLNGDGTPIDKKME